MEESNKKIINIALLVIWLAVIFYLSNQPGIQSSSLSDNLTLSIFSTVSDSLIVFVRKSAHNSEFFILALLMYNVFKDYFTINKSFLLTLIFSILYACIDEIHQIFIIGRECLVRDVL